MALHENDTTTPRVRAGIHTSIEPAWVPTGQRRFYTGRDGRPWCVTDRVEHEDFLASRSQPPGSRVARGAGGRAP